MLIYLKSGVLALSKGHCITLKHFHVKLEATKLEWPGQGRGGGETNGFGEKSPRIATQGTQLADLGCTLALLLRHLAPISSAWEKPWRRWWWWWRWGWWCCWWWLCTRCCIRRGCCKLRIELWAVGRCGISRWLSCIPVCITLPHCASLYPSVHHSTTLCITPPTTLHPLQLRQSR